MIRSRSVTDGVSLSVSKSKLVYSSLIFVEKKTLKSVNIRQSYKQERDCVVHFVRLTATLLKDGESAQNNHVLACNFCQKFTDFKMFSLTESAINIS